MVQKYSSRSLISRYLTSFFLTLLAISPLQAADLSLDDVLDISLEELLSIEVTSASKKKQKLSDIAAAVYVVTAEDIRRSGVTSIPEALRLAPGVQVARIDANKWSVSVRGFSGRFSNKLLVLMDGRSVYTPAYSGVYWNMNNTLMEDIDRIEVIRGPGGTVWGANAMNGVINIITKAAQQTEGTLVSVGDGDQEFSVAMRSGKKLNESLSGRVYFSLNKDESFVLAEDESDASDAWQSLQAGFRLDGTPDTSNNWKLQGDIYDNDFKQTLKSFWVPTSTSPFTFQDQGQARGFNILGQWNHELDETSRTSLNFYVDQYERDELYLSQSYETLDIDFQYETGLGTVHNLTWGLGYRSIKDDFDNTFSVSLTPDSDETSLWSVFAQDDIRLTDQLKLTLGAKAEHNDYTGLEVQPSIKGLWTIAENQSAWLSLSKAIRTPSRIEASGRIVTQVVVPVTLPYLPEAVAVAIVGSDDFKSEQQQSFELGYRMLLDNNLTLDATVFYNRYEDLQSYNLEPFPSTNINFSNDVSGDTSGLELVADWRLYEWWQLQTVYSYFHATFDDDSVSGLGTDLVNEGNTAEHQLSLRSYMQLQHNIDLDVWMYYMDELPVPSYNGYVNDINVESYTSLNLRLGWRPNKNIEWSLAAHNLLEDTHTEYYSESYTPITSIERSIYAKLKLEF